ncbi:MAG: polyprenol monophosphomannose synthase [Promethearchaeota archaeon]
MTIISKEIYELPEEKRFIKISNVKNEGQGKKEDHISSRDGLVIVLPTYNERKNLLLLIPVIEEIFENHFIDGRIIIVDDNSEDGTADVAIKFAKVFKNIIVIQRPGKLGLGSAYRLGFKHALATGKEFVMMMDADLSHRPSYIPTFLKCIKKYNAGLVIGSRYCKSGSTKDWPTSRKLVSHGANFFTRIALGVKQTKDMTSGYRILRADTLRAIDYNNLSTNGYAWMIEMLYRTRRAKHEIREIPITFYERELGQSKLGGGDIKEFVIFLFKAMYGRIKHALNLR